MKGKCLNTEHITIIIAVILCCAFAAYKLNKMSAGITYTQELANKLQQLPELINPSGKTINERFFAPTGFKRIEYDINSFEYYLQHLPLKKHGSDVLNYDGTVKRNKVHEAVINIDADKKDLQQCADAVIRLRAAYLYSQNKFNEIVFNFTNGFAAKYAEWRNGKRIKVTGNQCSWYTTELTSDTYQSFREYLNMVFNYAGTLSLSKQMQSQSVSEIKPGDLFIKGGSPGHAIIVVDVCTSSTGEKLVMLAQSYMPAQEIHVLKNFNDTAISPWYRIKDSDKLYTPE